MAMQVCSATHGPLCVMEEEVKSYCRFPQTPVKCWAYCPPGGLVTAGLSHAMAPFCTSVIVGKVMH